MTPRSLQSALPILTFHDISDERSVISIASSVFREGLDVLHRRGCQALGLTEIARRLRGLGGLPVGAIGITFDDGYRSVYQEAFPLLQMHSLAATVFLTVGASRRVHLTDRLPSLNGRAMLSWAEIREMQAHGVSIGAHTLTHPDLTRVSRDRLVAEVCDSKAVIEDMLGSPVDSFAYPFGLHDSVSREVVRQHYCCACSDRLAFATAASDSYALERVDAFYLRSDHLFALTGSRLFRTYVGACSIPRRLRRTVERRLRRR